MNRQNSYYAVSMIRKNTKIKNQNSKSTSSKQIHLKSRNGSLNNINKKLNNCSSSSLN